MAEQRALDLSQVEVAESFFTECQVSNSEVAIWPNEVTGYTTAKTQIFPLCAPEINRVAFDIRVKVVATGEENKPLPVEGSFRLHISFFVENLDDFLEYDEKFQEKTPNAILTASLIGVAYSTARGMILSKVLDTPLMGYGLPMRSARQLMHESQAKLEDVQDFRIKLAEAKPDNERALPPATELKE
jgi:hypothetical protein